jgi:hypothetical protein
VASYDTSRHEEINSFSDTNYHARVDPIIVSFFRSLCSQRTTPFSDVQKGAAITTGVDLVFTMAMPHFVSVRGTMLASLFRKLSKSWTCLQMLHALRIGVPHPVSFDRVLQKLGQRETNVGTDLAVTFTDNLAKKYLGKHTARSRLGRPSASPIKNVTFLIILRLAFTHHLLKYQTQPLPPNSNFHSASERKVSTETILPPSSSDVWKPLQEFSEQQTTEAMTHVIARGVQDEVDELKTQKLSASVKMCARAKGPCSNAQTFGSRNRTCPSCKGPLKTLGM